CHPTATASRYPRASPKAWNFDPASVVPPSPPHARRQVPQRWCSPRGYGRLSCARQSNICSCGSLLAIEPLEVVNLHVNLGEEGFDFLFEIVDCLLVARHARNKEPHFLR